MGEHVRDLSKSRIWGANLLILVLLGTHELQFTRLLKMVEDCIDRGIIKEKVIAQVGNTKYESDKMEIIKYLGYSEMESLIADADFILTHGGTGSIVTSLRYQKKVVAIPRLKKYNEHNDDHQGEILNVLQEEGHIVVYEEHDDLGKRILELESFTPKPFSLDNHLMLNIIRDFITK